MTHEFTDHLVGKLRKETIDELESKFNLIDCFDFHYHNYDPPSFYEWCSKWKDHTFAPNDRIIVLNLDSNYYAESQISNSNWNFFSCCAHFGLPTQFFIYFTASYAMHKEIFSACHTFNLLTPTVVESIFKPGFTPESTVPLMDIDYSADAVKKHYISLNGLQRSHRILLLCHLAERGLLDKGYITFNFATKDKDSKAFTGDKSTQTDIHLALRTTVPFTSVNDHFKKSILDQTLLNTHANTFSNQNQPLSIYGIDDQEYVKLLLIKDFNPHCLKYGLVYLITESIFDYPTVGISEKTIKAIVNKRPFVSLTSPNTLVKLRDLGFKTFDSFWSEGYDTVQDASQRLSAVVDVMEYICQQDLSKLARDLKDTVEYNFNHYRDNYAQGAHNEWYNES